MVSGIPGVLFFSPTNEVYHPVETAAMLETHETLDFQCVSLLHWHRDSVILLRAIGSLARSL